jgi:iron(III) transport system permease protein
LAAQTTLVTEGPAPSRVRRRGTWRQPLVAFAVFAVAAMPVFAILWIASSGDADTWRHLAENVIPRALGRTLALMAYTGLATALIGVTCAWLVSSCDFPLRRFFSAVLVLPLALPAYLAAYAFGEFFDFTGPVQTLVRTIFGFKTMRDYWFPDIRSLGGAVLVMTAVLYPYVYLACRSVFRMQGRAAADVARTLGAGPMKVFFRVQLPMARPALMIGLTLVMMETLNDIGAVQYLGVNTLTFAIYDTWLNRGSLVGAVQLACLILVFIAVLMVLERRARRRQRFASQKTTAAVHDAVRLKLKGWAKWAAVAACALPVLVGFVVPVLVLGSYAVKRLPAFTSPKLIDALTTSISVAAITAVVAVSLSFALSQSARSNSSRLVKMLVRLASFGYGIPGTVLAIGVLVPLAAFDNMFARFTKDYFGFSLGLILSGTGFAIVYACTVRFITMAEGNIDAGLQKLSPHLDMASRMLGHNARQTLWRVILPNLRPALLTAGLLVFIETLKELSATILLRPFNFNTLATLVYEDASRSQVANASVPAIIIIVAGLVPAILVSRSLERGT